MEIYRPGGTKLTREAVESCGFPKEGRLLDVGCGEGAVTEYLTKEYGFHMTGIDTDLSKVGAAKEKNPKLDVRYGDGEFLDEFPSHSFDGVLMECVLSLINLPDEALHEAYCVLKKGGKLILSDLYIRDSEPELEKALEIEARRASAKPHDHGDCNDDCNEEHKKRIVDFRWNGKFLKEPLLRQLSEIGFQVTQWEDKSKELSEFAAEKLLAGEDLAKYFCGGQSCEAIDKRTGYFQLIAQKPL